MKEAGQVRYGDSVIEYTVIRHAMPRQTVRVQVEPDGRVVVRAPEAAGAKAIAAIVKQRAKWVYRHLRDIKARARHHARRDWVSGESHRYLGRRYMLKVRVEPEGQERIALAGGQLRATVRAPDADRVRKLVDAWYREHASAWLRRRVDELAERLPWVRSAPQVSIRAMKSRWGSCSPAGRLTLNPLLVRAPREAIDYVIIHELCHLRHHDHGRAFYALLGRYVPGWMLTKKRLDASADALFAEQG